MSALVLPFAEPIPTISEIRAAIQPLERVWRRALAAADRQRDPDRTLLEAEQTALEQYLAACDRYSICRDVDCYTTTGGDYCARHRL